MCDTIQHLVDFRENLHRTFTYRSDATMDLIDAIGGNSSAKSAVELSLSPLFPRQYSSLHDAVDNFFVPSNQGKAKEERHTQQQLRMRLLATQSPDPVGRNFSLLSMANKTEPFSANKIEPPFKGN